MSSTLHQSLLNMRASTAAICTNCKAVALTGHPAAFVSFQRLVADLPLTQNVNSADSPLRPAVQFSGNIAQIASNAVTTETFVTF